MNNFSNYELYLHIVNVNVNWEIIFSYLDDNTKQEILTYIDFLKSKPSKKEFLNYKLSEKAFYYFNNFVIEVAKKTMETYK